MTHAQQIADRYIAAWNETDSDRRLTRLRQEWTDDARYADPLASVHGCTEISHLIGGVHERFPGFRFTLMRPAEGHGEHVRFAWRLGPDGAEAPIEGSDVVVTDGGRIAQVIGFLDKLPQTA